jgi:hypothetical protein
VLIITQGNATLTDFSREGIHKHYEDIVRRYQDKFNYIDRLAANQTFYDVIVSCTQGAGIRKCESVENAIVNCISQFPVYGIANCFTTISSIEQNLNIAELKKQEAKNGVIS